MLIKPEQNRQELREQIIAAGLKATQQRIVILEALQVLHDQHPTAEEVLNFLKTSSPGISLGTVYKTLDSLVAVGLAKRVLTDHNRRYDLNVQGHGHIYCTNTQEIIDYTDPKFEKLIREYFRTKNFDNFNIRDISLQIVGSKIDPLKKVIIT